MAKTIEMRSARSQRRAKKAAAAAKAQTADPVQVPFFMNHGRAWINGSEVGGVDPRYAHLDRSYD